MSNNLPTKERFVCSGHCMFHMSTEEETETDAPPQNETQFVGTEDEAMAAGWEFQSKEKAYRRQGMRDVTFLCPGCAGA